MNGAWFEVRPEKAGKCDKNGVVLFDEPKAEGSGSGQKEKKKGGQEK